MDVVVAVDVETCLEALKRGVEECARFRERLGRDEALIHDVAAEDEARRAVRKPAAGGVLVWT